MTTMAQPINVPSGISLGSGEKFSLIEVTASADGSFTGSFDVVRMIIARLSPTKIWYQIRSEIIVFADSTKNQDLNCYTCS